MHSKAGLRSPKLRGCCINLLAFHLGECTAPLRSSLRCARWQPACGHGGRPGGGATPTTQVSASLPRPPLRPPYPQRTTRLLRAHTYCAALRLRAHSLLHKHTSLERGEPSASLTARAPRPPAAGLGAAAPHAPQRASPVSGQTVPTSAEAAGPARPSNTQAMRGA